MKRIDLRIVFGALLLLGGALALLQSLGYLADASSFFWGSVLLLAGLAFIALLIRGHWWSAIPGFTLAALGSLIFLPDSLHELGGAIFLGGIAFSFWYIYFTDRVGRWWALIPAGVLTGLAVLVIASTRYGQYSGAIFLGGISIAFFLVYFSNRSERWWALIPGGVLGTLAAVTVVSVKFNGFRTAGVFFFGLAITFLLVALFAQMRWALWPAGALGVMGLLGMASMLQYASSLWAVALIVLGVLLLVRYYLSSRR